MSNRHGRRGFLKLLGLGGAGAVLGGTSKVLADQLSDEFVQEIADEGLCSQETANSLINYYEPAVEQPALILPEPELERELEPVEFQPHFLNLFPYAKVLHHELKRPFTDQGYCAQQGDTVRIYEPITPKMVKKNPEDFISYSLSSRSKNYEVEHFCQSVLICDDEISALTVTEVFRYYVDPSMQSIARLLNGSDYQYSFRLPVASAGSGIESTIHTDGCVPVRTSVSYDHLSQGTRLSMEVLVA